MNMKKPTLADKASAAIFILAHGVSHAGGGTRETLTWPFRGLRDDKVMYEAVNFLSDVLTAQLSVMPADHQSRLWKDQDIRLSEELELALLHDANPSRDEEPYPE
jgi:hypothetical protein